MILMFYLFRFIKMDTLYPRAGFVNETGGPGAYLKTINIPLPPGTTDEVFKSLAKI